MTQLEIVVGQYVECGLYWAGRGIIYREHKEGSGRSFDVVFLNGARTNRTPECIVRCIQWTIFPEVATSEEIAAALSHAEQVEARKVAEAEAAEQARAVRRESLLAEFPDLTVASEEEPSSPKLAAKNIRKELARAFPGVQFGVRSSYGGGNSIAVEWTAGPTSDQVEAIVGKYKYGHFDGMDDCYKIDQDAKVFTDRFGGARYLDIKRRISDAETERLERALCRLQGVEWKNCMTLVDGDNVGTRVWRIYSQHAVPVGKMAVGLQRDGQGGYELILMDAPPQSRRPVIEVPEGTAVETYSLKTRSGRHIRYATSVVFPDGMSIDFDEKLPKGKALRQAMEERAKRLNAETR